MRDLDRVRNCIPGFECADLKVVVMAGINFGAPKVEHRVAVGAKDWGTVLEQELKFPCRDI